MGFVFHERGKQGSETQVNLENALKLYGSQLDTDVILDSVQQSFECCGVHDKGEWLSSKLGHYPSSCCVGNLQDPKTHMCTVLNDKPCLPEIHDYYTKSASPISILAIFVALFPIVSSVAFMFLVPCLISQASNEYQGVGHEQGISHRVVETFVIRRVVS